MVFEERGKRECKEENLSEQARKPTTTPPTYGVDPGIWTRATKVLGECSHQCVTLALQTANKFCFPLGQLCYIAGWGTEKIKGPPTRILHEAALPLVSQQQCNEPQSYSGIIPEDMICAGFKQGGVDTCEGDSGGKYRSQEADTNEGCSHYWGAHHEQGETNTVEPVLSGHPRGMAKWPLNTGWPPYTGCKKYSSKNSISSADQIRRLTSNRNIHFRGFNDSRK